MKTSQSFVVLPPLSPGLLTPQTGPIPRSRASRGTALPGTKASVCWRKSPRSWWWISAREAGSRSRPRAGRWSPPPGTGRRSRAGASCTSCTCRSSCGSAPPCNTVAGRTKKKVKKVWLGGTNRLLKLDLVLGLRLKFGPLPRLPDETQIDLYSSPTPRCLI